MCYVACGRYEGFWELYLYPWDTAAGLVIATEAGARVSRFDGSPYSIYEREVLLTNGKIHEQMVEVLCLGKKQKAFS
jgi:myo-inositol-1(or 4)-monophosphatase